MEWDDVIAFLMYYAIKQVSELVTVNELHVGKPILKRMLGRSLQVLIPFCKLEVKEKHLNELYKRN